MRRYGSLKLGAKISLYVLTAAGLATSAAATYDFVNSSDTVNFPPTFLNGVVRSSRALFTISSCVVDYKYWLRGLPADSEEYGLALSEIHRRSARRILKLCDSDKGFYVKAGQFIASARQVPKEYSSTLSSLQDQAVPCNFEAVKEVIEKSLGKDLSEIVMSSYGFLDGEQPTLGSMDLRFLSFDKQPVAAASFAQVQYPGLEYQMKFDLATMALLSKSVAWLFPEYRFEWMVSEFTKTIASELDFIQEAKNSERAANNFRRNRMVRIPCVYWDFTSREVLTMQFSEGQKIDDLEYLKRMMWMKIIVYLLFT